MMRPIGAVAVGDAAVAGDLGGRTGPRTGAVERAVVVEAPVEFGGAGSGLVDGIGESVDRGDGEGRERDE